MAEKAESIIKDALQNLVVRAAEQPLTADQGQTCIRAMNRLMARLDATGVSLGYTEVTSLGDTVTVPDGALTGLINLLSLEVAPQFKSPDVNLAAVVALAELGLEAMETLAVDIEASSLPCTLPIGSGNEGDFVRTDRFYPCEAEQIDSESNQSILVEDDTETS